MALVLEDSTSTTIVPFGASSRTSWCAPQRPTHAWSCWAIAAGSPASAAPMKTPTATAPRAAERRARIDPPRWAIMQQFAEAVVGVLSR